MNSKQISCESCEKELNESSLVLHIGKKASSKEYYGKRFDELKKNRERKKIWRKTNGKKELQRQREIY